MNKKLLVLGISFAALAGCGGGSGTIHRDSPPPPRPVPASKPHATPTSGVHVPPGHMPPQGKCRLWYPGQPPGRQPPIGDCAELERRVPQGAVLVRG